MGDHKKPIEGGCQKRGARTFCQFKGGGLAKTEGWGGLYPNANYDLV